MTKYKCFYCEEESSEMDWNEETQKDFACKIVTIQTAIKQNKVEEHGFTCPKCKEYQDFMIMEQIENK